MYRLIAILDNGTMIEETYATLHGIVIILDKTLDEYPSSTIRYLAIYDPEQTIIHEQTPIVKEMLDIIAEEYSEDTAHIDIRDAISLHNEESPEDRI